MHDDDRAVVEIDEEIFSAPTEGLDDPAIDPGFEIVGQRNPEVSAAHVDARDSLALQRNLQAAANRLDFGKLGHDRSIVVRPRGAK